VTLTELRDAINRLAEECDGDLPVDIGIKVSEGGWRIIPVASIELISRPSMSRHARESVRIYSELIRADIRVDRPVPKGRVR